MLIFLKNRIVIFWHFQKHKLICFSCWKISIYEEVYVGNYKIAKLWKSNKKLIIDAEIRDEIFKKKLRKKKTTAINENRTEAQIAHRQNTSSWGVTKQKLLRNFFLKSKIRKKCTKNWRKVVRMQ